MRHDDEPVAPQAVERREVEVVVVRRARSSTVSASSGSGEAAWRRSCMTRSSEHRVGDERGAVELDEDGRMADVRQREAHGVQHIAVIAVSRIFLALGADVRDARVASV